MFTYSSGVVPKLTTEGAAVDSHADPVAKDLIFRVRNYGSGSRGWKRGAVVSTTVDARE